MRHLQTELPDAEAVCTIGRLVIFLSEVHTFSYVPLRDHTPRRCDVSKFVNVEIAGTTGSP